MFPNHPYILIVLICVIVLACVALVFIATKQKKSLEKQKLPIKLFVNMWDCPATNSHLITEAEATDRRDEVIKAIQDSSMLPSDKVAGFFKIADGKVITGSGGNYFIRPAGPGDAGFPLCY